MIVTVAQVDIIANLIKRYSLANVVIDPVVAPTRGVEFASDEVMRCMVDKLLPLSTIVTPNLPEAEKIYEILVGLEEKERRKIQELDQAQNQTQVQAEVHSLSAQELARCIGQSCGCNVLVKGGHAFGNEATDYIWSSIDEQRAGCILEFKGQKVEFAWDRLCFIELYS